MLVGRGGRSAEQRANAANLALRKAVDEGVSDVRVERQGDVAVVMAGSRPVIELGPEDAEAAGESSVQVLAVEVAAHARDAIRGEQSRSRTLVTILSLAFVVFAALAALFLARKVGELADRARAWIAKNPERLPTLHLRSIELIRPASLQSGLSIALSAGKALGRLAIIYGWFLLTLSLFESTRGYAERLTGFVFGPLYAFILRLAGSLPLLVVAAIAVIALVVLVRFIGLFFDSVHRGETRLESIPADLAEPTSILVRAAVVLAFVVVAAPIVSGDADGGLARLGTVTLVAIGLASTPLLASIAVGVTVIYGRRLTVGDFADFGGRSGRVQAITLLEVRLVDNYDKELRVPHLLSLIHPTRVLGPLPLIAVEVTLAPATAGQEDVRQLLLEAADAVGENPRVDLLSFDTEGATYLVATHSSATDAKSHLYGIVAEALAAAEVPLGRAPARRSLR